MGEFFSKLFSDDFMPHGHCFLWRPDILWLHVLSDVVIGLSYFSIPVVLVVLVWRRDDLVFDRMFMMFAAFIFACGTTHFMNVYTIWHGTYRIEGVIKLICALLSIATAVSLWPILPRILSIPGPGQLKLEIEKRRQAQEQLEAVNASLDKRISERTVELEQSVVDLKQETDKFQRFFNVTVDRELEMVRLKKEVDALLADLNRPPRYGSSLT